MMLTLPQRGLSRSKNSHNVDISVICDWLEASALFLGKNISGSEIVDVLCENEIYASQSFAWELVNDVFLIMRERGRFLGLGYPIQIKNRRITGVKNWKLYAPYSFCLMLSLRKVYPTWASAFGPDFTMQGELFEDLTAEAMAIIFRDWKVQKTGWAKSSAANANEIVKDVAGALCEATGNIERWTVARAKDAGLDLLVYLPFPDGRVGFPTYLFQCASGEDWTSKLHTPNLNIWEKIIVFPSPPKKAFSMPYALDESEFNRNTNLVNGPLFDRHRLLMPGRRKRGWLSSGLRLQIQAWVANRAAKLEPLTP